MSCESLAHGEYDNNTGKYKEKTLKTIRQGGKKRIYPQKVISRLTIGISSPAEPNGITF